MSAPVEASLAEHTANLAKARQAVLDGAQAAAAQAAADHAAAAVSGPGAATPEGGPSGAAGR